MSGPPPVPLERKRLLGNPGKRSLPVPARLLPAIIEGMPPYPARLRRRGKEVWARMWALGRQWVSPTTDIDIITALCRAHDQHEELLKAVRKDGLIVPGSKGQIVVHPALPALRALEAQMTRWWSLCGFTPADRTRLGIAEIERVSRLDSFIEKARKKRQGAGDSDAATN